MLLMLVAHNLRTYMRVQAAGELGFAFILRIFSTNPLL
jgi:CRISPR/Cas system CSM-associated protein Csm3 (group 7 of RAMP superfamily)